MVEALGIDLKTIIFAIANFLILMGILTKFLYRPFLDLLDRRKQSIKDAFDNAEMTNRKADEKLEAYNKKIAKVEAEGRDIIQNARVRADRQAQMIIDEAGQKAADMIKQAETQIERERQQALHEMRQQITELSMLAAVKIVEKELETTGQDRIIDDIIEQAGKSGWQN